MSSLITQTKLEKTLDIRDYHLSGNNSRIHQFRVGHFKVLINEVITENMDDDHCVLIMYPNYNAHEKYSNKFSDNCDMIRAISTFMREYEKPTYIPLRSKSEWLSERICEIHASIDSYIEQNIKVPIEWYAELSEHQNAMETSDNGN